MATAIPIDLGRLTRELGIDQQAIARTVALLDEGNTVPFITRYRRDQTGGLDEEQIAAVRASVAKLRQLEERKQTILKSIESQHALTPELREQIERADSVKRLEDLYLPYRPKKQTLATKAQEQGLSLLATEILTQDKAAADLDARAADFVNTDKGVADAASALLGAGHILAEQFSEDPELRQRVRKIYRKSGKLVSTKAEDNRARAEPEKPSAHAQPNPKPRLAASRAFRHLVSVFDCGIDAHDRSAEHGPRRPVRDREAHRRRRNGDGLSRPRHQASPPGHWKNADPDFQSRVAEVKRKLAPMSDIERRP